MTTLTQIGREEFTEKANLGFLDIYEKLWEDRFDRSAPISLLEIGVYNGNSLVVWDRWFLIAQIVGIDKHSQHIRPTLSSRIHLEYGDQADEVFLNQVIEKHGPFDIIIDDGGHYWKEQQDSFIILWPSVQQGGMYIIEDLQTSDDLFWQVKDEEPTTKFIANFVQDLMINGDPTIESIQLFHKLAIFNKK